MREIASFLDFSELENAFGAWFERYILQDYKKHGEKVNQPTPQDHILQRGHVTECADAFVWANDLLPESEDFSIQAMALATSQKMTLAQAQGKCHRFIRVHKSLKRLAESADRKMSALQSLLRN